MGAFRVIVGRLSRLNASEQGIQEVPCMIYPGLQGESSGSPAEGERRASAPGSNCQDSELLSAGVLREPCYLLDAS